MSNNSRIIFFAVGGVVCLLTILAFAQTSDEETIKEIRKVGIGKRFCISEIQPLKGHKVAGVVPVTFTGPSSFEGDLPWVARGMTIAADGMVLRFTDQTIFQTDVLSIGGMKVYLPEGIKGYTFQSQLGDPLTFVLLEKHGLVYLHGKGSVSSPKGPSSTLPREQMEEDSSGTVKPASEQAPKSEEGRTVMVISGGVIGNVVRMDEKAGEMTVRAPTFQKGSRITISSSQYSLTLDADVLNKSSSFAQLVLLDTARAQTLRDTLDKHNVDQADVESIIKQFTRLCSSLNPLGSKNEAMPIDRLIQALLEQPVPSLSGDMLRQVLQSVATAMTVFSVSDPVFIGPDKNSLQIKRVIIDQRRFGIVYAE